MKTIEERWQTELTPKARAIFDHMIAQMSCNELERLHLHLMHVVNPYLQQEVELANIKPEPIEEM